MNIGLFCSGGLGLVILNRLTDQERKVVVVFTDKGSEKIIEKCKQSSIPFFAGNPRKGDGAQFLSNFKIDVLLSVNYLFLINKDVFEQVDIAVNFHGSLLPKYRGRTPHVWAIINNEKKTGITAHLIDDGCDTGDILLQCEIVIEEGDTGASILEKYNMTYPGMVDKILNQINDKKLQGRIQNQELATYFGKRTPDGGQIYWNWQKERIRNWVRSQSHPYPGAFTYYREQKMTIDKIEFADLGFNSEMENGSILNADPLIVKTANGAVLIKVYRENFLIEKGEKFN